MKEKERIRELRNARPFRPYTIVLKDGREFFVDDPFAAMAPPTPAPRITVQDHDGEVYVFPPAMVKEIRVSDEDIESRRAGNR
jgi:hypothetical protein